MNMNHIFLKQLSAEKRYLSKLNRLPFDEKDNIDDLKSFISFIDDKVSFMDKNEENFITIIISYAIQLHMYITFFLKMIRVVNKHFSFFYDYVSSDSNLSDSFKSSWRDVYDGLKLMEEDKALILLSKAPVSIADYDTIKTSFINNDPDSFIACLNKSENINNYNKTINYYITMTNFTRFLFDYSYKCGQQNKEMDINYISLFLGNYFKMPTSFNYFMDSFMAGMERCFYSDELVNELRHASASAEEMMNIVKKELGKGRYEWLRGKQMDVLISFSVMYKLFQDFIFDLPSVEQNAVYNFISNDELFMPYAKIYEELADDSSWNVPPDLFDQPLSKNVCEFIGDINDKYKNPEKIKELIEKFVAEGWLTNTSLVKQWTVFYLTGRAKPEKELTSTKIWEGKVEELLYTCLFLYKRDGSTVPPNTYKKAVKLFGIETKITQFSSYTQRADSSFVKFLSSLFDYQ